MANLSGAGGSDALTLQDVQTHLAGLSPDHAPMLRDIEAALPAIRRDTAVFGRQQSQFMDATLTCSHPTPIRNLRQVLSEIHRAMSALHEAVYAMKKRELEAKIKDAEADEMSGGGVAAIKSELLRVEASELRSHNSATVHAISGAIRKVRALSDQRAAILEKLNTDHITEADFEADEARYHVMKAFEQALCAARSRGGTIDEGNHIYLCHLGINGALAQHEIDRWLAGEREAMNDNKVPGPNAYQSWLESMADAYAHLAAARVELHGMRIETSASSLLADGGEA